MITPHLAKKTSVNIIEKEFLDSTNTFLKDNAGAYTQWTCVRAIEQGSGRGRFTRVWRAEKGLDLTFSMLLDVPASVVPFLSSSALLVGVLLHQNFSKLGVDAMIKWPNDILVNNRKLAGILVESITNAQGTRVVIGIGVNCNSLRLNDPHIQGVSLVEILHTKIDISKLMLSIIEDFIPLWEQFCVRGISAYKGYLESNLAWKNRPVSIEIEGEKVVGSPLSISSEGALRFRVAKTGAIVEVISGEIVKM